jgi:hypothetical protein
MLAAVQKDLISITTWMLQRNLLVQLQSYPFLSIPNASLPYSFSQSNNSNNSNDLNTNSFSKSNSEIDYGDLNEAEKYYINSLPPSPSVSLLKRFSF